MPRQYVHPEFGVFCPTPRFRRWVKVALAGIALGVVGLAALGVGRSPDDDSALAVARFDSGSSAETGAQAGSPPAAAAIDPRANFAASRITADKAEKPACPGQTWSYVDGKCVASSPRKPRMVRVPTYRPAIAGVPLGRSNSIAGNSGDSAPTGAASNRQSEPSKTAQAASPAVSADAATTASTEPTQRAAATPKKKVAHNQRRRDPYGAWREVRVDDWYARSYAPRGGYGGYGGYGSYRSY